MWQTIIKDLLKMTDNTLLASQLGCSEAIVEHIASGFVVQPYLMLGIQILNLHAQYKPELYTDS